jgi:hypothetical protein
MTTASPEPAAATKNFSEEEKRKELEAIAQRCGDDSEQLCAQLAPYFPGINVARELTAYRKSMQNHSKTPTPRGFVRWLLRAEPAIKPLPRKASTSNGVGHSDFYEAAMRASIEKGDKENQPQPKSRSGDFTVTKP